MWEKIVLNLISNAFKYTLEGEIAVSLRESAGHGRVELRVRDTGVGIPERNCPGCSSAFIGSRASTAARTKAPASASRWSRNWRACMAER